MKNLVHYILILTMLFSYSLASAVPTSHKGSDRLQWGRTDANPKVFEALNGLGGSNPTIIADPVQDDWNFNKSIDVTGSLETTGSLDAGTTISSGGNVDINGDSLDIGDGTGSDKDITFDIGAGASNPLFRWLNSGNVLQFCNSGTGSCITIVDGANKTLSNLDSPTDINQDLISNDFSTWVIRTKGSGAADSVATGDLLSKSGNKSGGTGDSGKNRVETGDSVGGLAGDVVLEPGDGVSEQGKVRVVAPILSISDPNSTNGVVGSPEVSSGAVASKQFIGRSGNMTGTATADSGNSVWRSGNITNAGSSAATGNSTVKSGNNSGSGPSGDTIITVGTVAGGLRGKIKLRDGSEGTSGECWVSTDTTGEGEWQTCPGGTADPNVESFNSADTLDSDNDIALCDSSGGTFAITLPTAVGITGKIYDIVKIEDSTVSVTINTTSSQTIGTRSSGNIGLNRLNDYIRVVSDGTNWEILGKKETEILTASASAGYSGETTSDFLSCAASVTVDEGIWRVQSHFGVDSNTGTGVGLNPSTGLYSADGADSASTPALLSAGTNVSSVEGDPLLDVHTAVQPLVFQLAGNFQRGYAGNSEVVVIIDGGTQSIFSVPLISFSTTGAAVVKCYIKAERMW